VSGVNVTLMTSLSGRTAMRERSQPGDELSPAGAGCADTDATARGAPLAPGLASACRPRRVESVPGVNVAAAGTGPTAERRQRGVAWMVRALSTCLRPRRPTPRGSASLLGPQAARSGPFQPDDGRYSGGRLREPVRPASPLGVVAASRARLGSSWLRFRAYRCCQPPLTSGLVVGVGQVRCRETFAQWHASAPGEETGGSGRAGPLVRAPRRRRSWASWRQLPPTWT
jgi:hypothetical protein